MHQRQSRLYRQETALPEPILIQLILNLVTAPSLLLNLEKEYTDEDEAELKKYLGSIGDSLVVVSDDEIVKIHVHTNHPGLAFEKGLTYGSLSRMKVDNMREEHEERVIQDSERLAKEQAQADAAKTEETQPEEQTERKEYGFIAVSCGDGLSEIFKGIGADLSDRRRPDHESKHRGYVKCHCSGKCRYTFLSFPIIRTLSWLPTRQEI